MQPKKQRPIPWRARRAERHRSRLRQIPPEASMHDGYAPSRRETLLNEAGLGKRPPAWTQHTLGDANRVLSATDEVPCGCPEEP